MPRSKTPRAKSGARVDANVKSTQSASADVTPLENVDVVDAPARHTRVWMHLTAVALLLLFAAQLFFSGKNQSTTMDEPSHNGLPQNRCRFQRPLH